MWRVLRFSFSNSQTGNKNVFLSASENIAGKACEKLFLELDSVRKLNMKRNLQFSRV